MTAHVPDLATALAEAAREINAPRSLEETLDAIVHAARHSVPGFDHIGISRVHGDGRIETLAATGQLVWELDGAQYELGEGPCVKAMREEPIVVAPHIKNDQRWPRYVPRAVAAGLRAQLAIQLYYDDETLGGLNLYSTESAEIDPDAPVAAELFAVHAALALGRARTESQLNEALGSRQVIGEAVGLMMERYKINDQRAFQFLARASTTSNLKVRDVAQELVDEANRLYTPEVNSQ
jgi:GAF domain-containing protein